MDAPILGVSNPSTFVETDSMAINERLWKLIRCVSCGRPAEHAVELAYLDRPANVVMGFCTPHHDEAKRTPAWNEMHIVEADVLERPGGQHSPV